MKTEPEIEASAPEELDVELSDAQIATKMMESAMAKIQARFPNLEFRIQIADIQYHIGFTEKPETEEEG